MKMWMSLISLAVLLPLALGNSCLCDSRPVRRALMDLYVATGGAQWTNSSGWGTPSAVCAWYGISCVGDEFTVSLGHNNLVGTLPSSWGDASSIQRVFLEGNRLTGPLPESWGGMRGLRTLTLYENGLTGTLPASWANMTSLYSLQLCSNALSGVLPLSWARMSKLSDLCLRSNRLSGTLPDSYGDMEGMSSMDLEDNGLSGTLPDSWHRLRVVSISLSKNRLEGSLPPSWSALSGLRLLHLSANRLTGTVPRVWAQLRRLQSFDVSVNRLSGTTPDWFDDMRWFNISHNEFSGLPAVCRFSHFYPSIFGFSHNKFAGRISVPCVAAGACSALPRSLFDGNAFCGMCSLPPCTCASPASGDVEGPSITTVTVVGRGGCCAACQKHPQCVAAVYHADMGHCELKNVSAPIVPNAKLEVLVLH